MTTFADLHKQYRTHKQISRAELAAHIQKDPSYIRRIEIEDYVPNFVICEKIAEKLELSPSEKHALYTLGFQKRIANDIGFYNSLRHYDTHHTKARPSLCDTLGTENICRYYICWDTYERHPWLIPPLNQDVILFLSRTFQALNIACHHIQNIPEQLLFVVDIPPDTPIKTTLATLQERVSGFVHTTFSQLDLPTDLWESHMTIRSLGAWPTDTETPAHPATVTRTAPSHTA